MKYLIANWKMNGNVAFAREYIETLQGYVLTQGTQDTTVVFCPPYPYLNLLNRFINKVLKTKRMNTQNSSAISIYLGAQDVSQKVSGSYTGEVGGSMLRDCGCEYVIIGHAEYRALYGDRNIVNKVHNALDNNIIPIVCVGETEENFSTTDYSIFFEKQFNNLKDVLQYCIIAYEPIWAIGKKITVSLSWLQSVVKILGTYHAKAILYGGGVTLDNIKDYLKYVDGLLVGSQSLKPDIFGKMIQDISVV